MCTTKETTVTEPNATRNQMQQCGIKCNNAEPNATIWGKNPSESNATRWNQMQQRNHMQQPRNQMQQQNLDLLFYHRRLKNIVILIILIIIIKDIHC